MTKSLSVKDVLSKTHLESVWKTVKGNYRHELLRGPLDLLEFEANLDTNLKQLSYLVCSDRYTPSAPTVIRAAKRDGLTRPLCFLDVTDILVLKAITDSLQDGLHADFPPCVGFGRTQQKAFRETAADYETWFQAWMKKQRTVEKLLEVKGCKWVVMSDISNFFASIDHTLLASTVSSVNNVEAKLINLLLLIIESMCPRPGYSINRRVGLPQENYDASRILAHAFLRPVDKTFSAEIRLDRYSRWVDDFVVGVETKEDGHIVLKRLETSLEHRGLHVNSAKSKVVSVENFAQSMYPKWNEFLDKVHESTKKGTRMRSPSLEDFDNRLNEFLAIPTSERLSDWDRVLRRFYTESHRMGSSILEKHALEHIRKFPSCTEKILNYMVSRPFDKGTLEAIWKYLASDNNLYEDVEIRLYEHLLLWAIPDDPAICDSLASVCLDHFFGIEAFGNRRPMTPQAEGLIVLAVYKFARKTRNPAFERIYKHFDSDAVLRPEYAGFALCTLSGTDNYREEAFRKAECFEDRGVRRLHSFLTTAYKNPNIFFRILKDQVTVRETLSHGYKFFPARMLPIVKLIQANKNDRGCQKKWISHLENVVRRLQPKSQALHDYCSIGFIERTLQDV